MRAAAQIGDRMAKYSPSYFEQKLSAAIQALVDAEPSQRRRLKNACQAAHAEFLDKEAWPPEPVIRECLDRIYKALAEDDGEASCGAIDRLTDEQVQRCIDDLVACHAWALRQGVGKA